MYLADLTSYEVDSLDRNTPVVVPFAAIEQHGPHLPIGTDSFIVEAILRRLESRDREACLWLPVERFGSSPHHMAFPGTVTLSSRTFLDVALEITQSFVAHGFRRFLLLNGHGGNQALLNVAVQEIRMGGGRRVTADRSRDVRAVHASYWSIAAEAFSSIRESPPGGMGHAGEMETSVLLAIHPELVRTDRRTKDGDLGQSRFGPRDMLAPGRVGQFRFFDEFSRQGPVGDPSTATASKGERFLEAAVDAVAELLRELRDGKVG